jgi:2-polyprenyl-6-methoxyphenol hydroxylase-like FAD-dependent oxidoreductase
MVLVSAAPGRPAGLFLAGYENDTWMFTVSGWQAASRQETATECWHSPRITPQLTCWLQCGRRNRFSEVARHRMPSSQWRRYDKMRRFPDGLLVCGDAICSVNPVYGQGMTVSALEAAALRDCLRVGSHDLARRYFRAAAKSIRVAWQMAAGNDLTFPEVQGRRSLSMRVTNRCADWVLSACESDTVTAERFFRVNNLIDPPTRLLRPSFIGRVAAVNMRRRQGDTQPREAQAVRA